MHQCDSICYQYGCDGGQVVDRILDDPQEAVEDVFFQGLEVSLNPTELALELLDNGKVL